MRPRRRPSCARPPHFNPRTPCGVRPQTWRRVGIKTTFQSTHPMRGATQYRRREGVHAKISIHAPHAGCDKPVQYLSARFVPISIHAPHAGCDQRETRTRQPRCISIHAPHAGCDARRYGWKCLGVVFQSTHPMRGATKRREHHDVSRTISIHAPHAGCDFAYFLIRFRVFDFNPRTPCGVRLYS